MKINLLHLPHHLHKVYWWKEQNNFGDRLAPLLLKHFAYLDVEWASISHASIVSTGSVLEHIPPLWDGYVLGSGKLFENSRLYVNPKVAKVLAVRGPLSARYIKSNYTFALGDPGILANELVGPQKKIWDLGIIPHWQDKELAGRFKSIIKPPATIKVINATDDPITILQQIGSCKRIVTSSLHGMIVADAFGIPRRVEICSAMARDGGDFKFRDYSASIKTPFVVGKMVEVSRLRVNDVQFEIYDAYQELSKRVAE